MTVYLRYVNRDHSHPFYGKVGVKLASNDLGDHLPSVR